MQRELIACDGCRFLYGLKGGGTICEWADWYRHWVSPKTERGWKRLQRDFVPNECPRQLEHLILGQDWQDGKG